MIDVEIFGKTGGKEGDEGMSLYRRFLLNKQPEITFRNYEKLNQNLENLKRMRGPNANPAFLNRVS